MNNLEQAIQNWFSNDVITNQLESNLQSNPNHSFNVNSVNVTLKESVDLFIYLKNIILQAIDDDVFRSMPTPMQLTIHNLIQQISTHRNNINQEIINIQNLYNQVVIANLEQKLKSYNRFKQSLSDIANLRRSYAHTIKGLDKLDQKIKVFEENISKSIELINKTTASFEDAKSFHQEINTVKNQLIKSKSEVDKTMQLLENSKKEILAFKANIDSYKKDVDSITASSQTIVNEFENKRKQVDKLISDSEKALGLKSTEGISAALSSQYEKEDMKHRKNKWLWGSFVFMAIALVGVFLLLFEFNIGDKVIAADSTNAILARIVFVAISLTGATFTAKQYLRQKNLADNYAYKLVLAKSIVAFAQEIEKHDEAKAADYLNNVLAEINKSPLSKGKDFEDAITSDNVKIVKDIIESAIKKQ